MWENVTFVAFGERCQEENKDRGQEQFVVCHDVGYSNSQKDFVRQNICLETERLRVGSFVLKKVSSLARFIEVH